MARRRIARIHVDRLYPVEADGGALPVLTVGDPAWFAWLALPESSSFSYEGPDGTFTARRERRHGRWYWYAYRTRDGALRKVYLGAAGSLTADRLASAAANLADGQRTAPVDHPQPVAPTPSASWAPVSGVTPLLATKLFVPRPRPDLVDRPLLLARLEAGLRSSRCTLLAAPAGSGKTSLLAAWLASAPRPVAWLALDERDQDVHQFLRYIVAAFQSVDPACGRTITSWLDAPPPPPSPDAVLTVLLNDLASLATPCLLVLDDYHLVRTPEIHRAVAFLVEHLPPSVHLVIASREDPPLPLPRLRARGHLSDLRAADLRFTPEEARLFLADGMAVHISDEHVAALVARTEGWAAGLQLAGLSLRDRPDPSTFVAAFAGSHRLVADYLTSEVLDRQPGPIRRFLLATGLLDRLCAPLCDALLASDGEDGGGASSGSADSRVMLEDLERANLFLVPLDDERRWYRYHHLFADALRARLVRELGADGVASLHRRASAWLAREGLLAEAIRHALAAGAFEDAANWVEALLPSLLARGSAFPQLDRWLSALPDAVVRSRPRLCMGRVWLLVNQFDQESAEAWADAADRALAASTDPDGARRLRTSLAAARAYMAALGPAASPERAQALAEHALAGIAPGQPGFVIACVSLGTAVLAQGRPRQAAHAFGEAAIAGRTTGQLFSTLIAAGQQVSILSILGERRRALAAGRSALDWLAEQGHPLARGIGPLSAAVSDVLREGDEPEAALALATDGLRALRTYENEPQLIALASLTLARAHLALGDGHAAAAVLAEARPLVSSGPFAALTHLIAAGEAQARLALNEPAAALAWATAAEPPPLPEFVRFGAHLYAAGIQALGVAGAQVLVALGRAGGDHDLLRAAERALDDAWLLAEDQGLGWLRLKVLILRALAVDGLGARSTALDLIRTALAQAEPEGYVRPFVDEGAPMATLLTAARVEARKRGAAAGAPTAEYIGRILATFPATRPACATPGGHDPRGLLAQGSVLAEPLSARELDVLRLLAAGRSNAAMARELVVEQSTVKSHLVHLYGKLGVHSRTQAVARARALRLLD